MITDRIDIRDAETVGNHGAGRRAAPRSHGNPVLFRKPDEIPDDQEIIDKAHRPDGLKFEVEPVLQFRCHRIIALNEAGIAQLVQIGPAVLALRNIEMRDLLLAESKLNMASVGDLLCVFKCLRRIWENLRHLFGRFHIVLSAGIAHPVLIG